MSDKKLSANEYIKTRSNYLRGTIAEGLADLSTGSMSEDDQQLLKFHGTYQQDDRDIRADRRKHKLEKAYSFMIRIRVPGGVATPQQWLETDRLATQFANGTIKLTTRQAFQFHGIIKTQPQAHDQGDQPGADGHHRRLRRREPQRDVQSESLSLGSPRRGAQGGAGHFRRTSRRRPAPITRSGCDGEKIESSRRGESSRSTARPTCRGSSRSPSPCRRRNDVDIYANCLSFIAIVEDGKLVGYNVAVGGGMGSTHGNEATYPRLADVIGFCTPEQVVDVAEKVVLVQRDFGDRTDRKHSRFKYTVDDHGPEWILAKLNEYLGYELGPVRDFKFDDNGDRFGWVEDANGNSHLTLFIQGGRVLDTPSYPMRTGLREIAKIHDGDFRLTANQNLIIANISPAKRPEIETLLEQYGIKDSHLKSALRLNSLACVALPTCGLALAEAERYLPDLSPSLRKSLEEAGLRHDAITIRMTGCPNGCARPFISEIGFVGRGPDRYNVYLGGGFAGQRLSKLYREDVARRRKSSRCSRRSSTTTRRSGTKANASVISASAPAMSPPPSRARTSTRTSSRRRCSVRPALHAPPWKHSNLKSPQ